MATVNERTRINIKITTVVVYLLLITAIFYLLLNSPAMGYEISIYTAILPFWVLIFCAASIAIILLIYLAYLRMTDNFWPIFFALLLCSFIIFTLPISRGYFLYGSNDPNGHYESTVSIINSGHFIENYYPITHIFGAVISILTALPVEFSVKLIPPILSMVFIIFSYYLANAVFHKPCYGIIAAAISMIPLFSYYHVTIYPHATAIFFLPLIFYLYFKSIDSKAYRGLLFLFLLLEAFVHVIPSIIITGCLVGAEFTRYFITRINNTPKINISFYPAITSIIVFFIWWSSYSVFGRVEGTVQWFVGEASFIPNSASSVEPVTAMGRDLIIQLYLKMYGNQLLLTIITIVAIIAILMYFFTKRNHERSLVLSVILLSSAAIYILIFFAGGFMTIGRLFGANYGVWAMPILVAYLFTRHNNSKYKVIIFSLVIIIIFICSMISVYRSDWILQPNWQTTYHDHEASLWQSSHSSNLIAQGIISSPLGQIPTGYWSWSSYVLVPAHFGYDQYDKFGETLYKNSIIYYGETRQKMINDNEILKNSTLDGTWALTGFNDADYRKLENDTSVDYIYSNGDVKILFVSGSKSAENDTV